MQNDKRRQTLISNTETILSGISILDRSSVCSMERNRCEYIGSMASELSKMAIIADEQFLGYLLDLAAKEAQSRKAYSRRRVSPN